MGRGRHWPRSAATVAAALAIALALVAAGRGPGPARGQEGTPRAAATPAVVAAPAGPRAAAIVAGSCGGTARGEVVAALSDLTLPTGEQVGPADGVTAETSFTSAPLTLDAILVDEHALRVLGSDDQGAEAVACGDIGGVLDETGSLQFGLEAVAGSGLVGIAYLSPGDDGLSTNVSVFLADRLVAVAPEAAAGAGGAGAEEASEEDEPRVAAIAAPVDVGGDDPGDGAIAATPSDALDGAVRSRPGGDGQPGTEAEPRGDRDGGRRAADEDPVSVVDVTLTEFMIDMPTVLEAGQTTFNVINEGALAHDFAIRGEGIDEELAERLQAGESATLTVDLEPGGYQVFCPIGNHADQGMGLEVTVE